MSDTPSSDEGEQNKTDETAMPDAQDFLSASTPSSKYRDTVNNIVFKHFGLYFFANMKLQVIVQ